MEQKEDFRVQKTFDALSAAFQELIVEKPFDRITVRELCNRAKTRTATFYNHFSDKYDFFAFMVRRMGKQYLDQGKLAAAEMDPEQYILSILKFAMDFWEQNESFICAIDSNSVLAPTLHLIVKEMTLQIKEHFQMLADRGNLLSTSPEILAELFTGAASQISRWWFVHRREISREELMEELSKVLPRMVLQ